MKIELYNDKKGKWQSFEAKCSLEDTAINFNGWYNCHLEAYGATEEEAYENLKKIAQQQIKDLNNLIEKLERNETVNKTAAEA